MTKVLSQLSCAKDALDLRMQRLERNLMRDPSYQDLGVCCMSSIFHTSSVPRGGLNPSVREAEFLVKNVAIRASCDLLHLLTACSAFDPSGSLNTRFLNNTLGQTWVLTCSSPRRKKKWNKKRTGARPRESHHKMITGSQLLLRYLLATYPVCCTSKKMVITRLPSPRVQAPQRALFNTVCSKLGGGGICQ